MNTVERLTITIYLGDDEFRKLERLRKALEEEKPELFKDQTIEETAALVSKHKFRSTLEELLEISGKTEPEGETEDADS